jgi:Uma2 family endonuclease
MDNDERGILLIPTDDLLREAHVMVTELDPRQGTEKGLKPYRLTVEQFEKMIDAGVFPDRPRVELLGGVLFRKMTKNDPHNYAVGFLGSALNRLLEPAWLAQEEKPVILGKFWRPEPDIAVVRGPRDRYRKRAPHVEDLGLLIEVCDATYSKDRGMKWRGYAAAGVETYWIVNLPQERIEIYAEPSGKGKAAVFQEIKFYGADVEAPLVLDGQERGRIAVKDIVG